MAPHSLVFRVDATAVIGAGHLMRCQALAHSLNGVGIESIFLCSADSQSFVKQLKQPMGRFYFLPENTTQVGELNWLLEQSFWASSAGMLVDGYQFARDYREGLRAIAPDKWLGLWDDLNDSGALDIDLLINTSPAAPTLGYEATAPEATLCLGGQFHPLRPEFYQTVQLPFDKRQEIAVVMGGSDPLALTLMTIDGLVCLNTQWRDPVKVNVIATEHYPRLEEIRDLCASNPQQLSLLINPDAIADIFGRSRLVISAAGGTQFELLQCHTPSVLVIVAENQVPATQQAQLQGWCEALDARAPTFKHELMETVKALWGEPDGCKTKHETAKKVALSLHQGMLAKVVAEQLRKIAA